MNIILHSERQCETLRGHGHYTQGDSDVISFHIYGVVICLERDADRLHIVQLMPLHPKPRHLLPHLNPDCSGYPGKEAVKRV